MMVYVFLILCVLCFNICVLWGGGGSQSERERVDGDVLVGRRRGGGNSIS